MCGASITLNVTPNLDFVTNFLCIIKSESCNSVSSAASRSSGDWHFNIIMTDPLVAC